MKKFIPVIIAIVCMIGVVLGCIYWYKSATIVYTPDIPVNPNINQDNNQDVVQNETNENDDNKEEIKNEPIFTVENYPSVDASLAIHPLVDSIASDFLGIPEEELNYEYTKGRTSDVYKNLIDGNADVIFAAEPSQSDLDYAKSKGVELEIIPTTSSAFVFIVNTENPVENLSLEEIQELTGIELEVIKSIINQNNSFL